MTDDEDERRWRPPLGVWLAVLFGLVCWVVAGVIVWKFLQVSR